MKVNLQSIYGQNSNGIAANGGAAAARKNAAVVQTSEETDGSTASAGYDPKKLITKQERKFFIKLFPESSEQLEKHVLFTKNGTVTTAPTQKGLLLDGRA